MQEGNSSSPQTAASGFNISRWSIEHPYVVIAFYTAMVILAVIAIGFYMPRRFMPYVQSPMIGIVSMMPGLSAQEMEMYISKPTEERLINIPGVRYIRSTSQEGFSIVSLEFPYGTDIDKKLVEVQALLNVIQADLPMTGANLKPSWVLKIDPLNLPVLSLALTGDHRWDMKRLRELADNEISNRLKAVSPDIFTVQVFGGYRRQIQVIVDRKKLAAYGISITQLRDVLDAHNVAKPAGALTAGTDEEIVRLDTLGRDADTIANYPLTGVNGRVVYVKDVAKVVDTFYEPRSGYHHYYRVGNQAKVDEAIEISILQSPEASSPRVIRAVMREVERLERDYPGLKFRIAYDNSAFVGVLLSNMFEELGLAVLLTGIVVLLFLGNWRGTLIAMTAIPVSLAMALLALIPMGMTLNSSTLIGLLISIGRLVDDAIIDVHAVERHLRMGKDPKTAAVDGITEVRLAVAASTLMLILALTPLLFCGGIVELMFVGLVWPLIFGLLASFLVSLTLTALMAAYLLKPHDDPAVQRERQAWLYRKILQPFQNLLDRTEQGYGRLIEWMLKNRFANLARIFSTIIIGFGFYYFIGSEMMPLADVGQAYMTLEMEPGASYAATESAVRQIERIMEKYPEIQHASIEIGFEGGPGYTSGAYFNGYSMGMTNGAVAMLTFTDKDTRKRDIWTIMDGIVAEATATIPGIRRLQIKEMGSDVMASSAAPIQLLVYGPDLKIVSMLAEQVAHIARTQVPDIYQVATSWAMEKPTYQIQVDARRAAELGLTPAEIAEQAYYALRGGFTTEFFRMENKRQTTILIRYDEKDRLSPSDIEQLSITTADGRQVPLKTVARVEYRETPTLIERDNFRRVVSVMGYYRKADYVPPGREGEQVRNRPSMDVAMDVMMRAQMQLNWPPGYGIEVRGDMTQMMDSFRRLLQGLMLAVVFIFLVLVAQFRGFLQPAQMVFSLPLELSGVFFALWLTGQAFSSVSIMAVIVLTGMDITTAILLIDLIMRYRDQGIPRNKAVIQACPQRLRPILMTSLTTIIALSPVAFAPPTGIDAYQPLGTVIIGGLIAGTVLTLLDIPIMHTLVDDAVRWWLIKVRRRDPASLPPVE
ncbi:MAG: efflux RND transporter permease subunit [Firmicutes bacterium]|nr:efflux RND transporter permease subunit [Bacillota bacterium]